MQKGRSNGIDIPAPMTFPGIGTDGETMKGI
jgi:hypothetical protein